MFIVYYFSAILIELIFRISSYFTYTADNAKKRTISKLI